MDATHPDEIDLIDLFQTLWKKKWWIALSAMLFTALAGVYAFTAKEQWTSTATVTTPRSTDLGDILSLKAEYAWITGDSQFSPDKEAEVLHKQFRQFLHSTNLKRQFLTQSEWGKKHLDKMKENEKQAYISHFISQALVVKQLDAINRNKAKLDEDDINTKISLSEERPALAQDLLNQYIDFINYYTATQISNELKLAISLRLDRLNFTKQKILSSLTETKKIQIDNLTQALNIVKKAGPKNNHLINSEYLINDTMLNAIDTKPATSTYLLTLDEEHLQEKINFIKNAKDVYPLEYYWADREITQLELLNKKADNLEKTKTYHYLSSPNYPLGKDKPKKILIILTGFISGLLFGCVLFTLPYLFKKRFG
ncbi:hypothetical protein A4G20_03025 [Pasteurellaceae bacterium RH1A]|nr:hypothetical protein A4G20_03025 [Pasteurellaceae bacterium RH1A]